ncbi:Alpha amylase, partial [Gryllus bimaculatus]
MCATWSNPVGYGGDVPDPANKYYPAVSYSSENFHSTCSVNNYNDANNVRNCELSGLHDLDQSQSYVRGKIVDYLNTLVSHGVAGFRVDAAKHMWPADLEAIYAAVNDLSTDFFPSGTRPFFYQEVIDQTGTEAVKSSEYTGFGVVTEFKYGSMLSNAFKGNNPIHWLVNWGTAWGLLDSDSALAFIDNHDNQRGSGATTSLTMMPALLLTAAANILDVTINSDNTCGNGWVCEHRWRQTLTAWLLQEHRR